MLQDGSREQPHFVKVFFFKKWRGLPDVGSLPLYTTNSILVTDVTSYSTYINKIGMQGYYNNIKTSFFGRFNGNISSSCAAGYQARAESDKE